MKVFRILHLTSDCVRLQSQRVKPGNLQRRIGGFRFIWSTMPKSADALEEAPHMVIPHYGKADV
jgi:hypothetical protein